MNIFLPLSYKWFNLINQDIYSIGFGYENTFGDLTVFIYFRCCVILKNTRYAKGEAVIQFGPSCLTPVEKIPALRIFAPQWAVNVEAVVSSVAQMSELVPFTGKKEPEGKSESPKELVLLYDTRCSYAIRE